MALFLAPRQFQRRSDLYHQLSQFLTAGITLTKALEMLASQGALSPDRPCLRRLGQVLREGASLGEALAGTGDWLPSFDRALLHAGEISGRLPECFHLLSTHYAERAALARQTLSDLAYPLLLLHFAVFLFPFPQFFASVNLALYLGQTLGLLIPLYVVVLVIVYALQSRRSEAWRALMERLLHPIPLLGPGRRSLALGRLASSLEALLSAGVNVVEAWEIAALACGSPAVCAAVAGWTPNVRRGQTPGEAVRISPVFPEVFAGLYQTGEVSGKLDDSLRHLARYYQEEGTRKLRLLAVWGPRMFYFLVAGLIACKIVLFYTNYFGQVGKIIDSTP